MELYVHFPFCRQKCRYCDFASYPGLENSMPDYVSALLEEAELRRKEVSSPIQTVYLGGGTPSLLPAELMEACLLGLKERLPLDSVQEWTVEANPGTLTEEWLQAVRDAGVNRLSLGMQAYQSHLLKTLGRIHDFSAVERSVRMARTAGFENLSLDLIFGLPGQTRQDWQETIQKALSLSPTHLSAYGLIPEEGTPLSEDLASGRLSLPEPEDERDMYDLLLSVLAKNSFLQYEISNFALPGYACRHNIGYWSQVPYLGLGASASSMGNMTQDEAGMHYLRSTNTADPEAYRRGIREKKPLFSEKTEISPAEARFETMMLGLRMNRGVSEECFERMHRRSLRSCYGEKLNILQEQGLVCFRDGAWKCTRKGMDLQNSVLVELMD